jgi:SAM-dependent methyltransferase
VSGPWTLAVVSRPLADPPAPDDDALRAMSRRNYDDFHAWLDRSSAGRRVRFLNFGMAPQPGADQPSVGRFNAEAVRLLVTLVGDVPLDGRRVLDVGCGRGGNLQQLHRRWSPALLVGVDQSAAGLRVAVDDHVRAVVGDAEQLPLRSGGFDVLLNVESLSLYPDPERFFGEAARVLVPGGDLLVADLTPADVADLRRRALEAAGFDLHHDEDVTDAVVAARHERAPRQARVLGGEHGGFDEWAGTTESWLAAGLEDGSLRYLLWRARRSDRPSAGPVLSTAERARARELAIAGAHLLTVSGR